MQVVDINTPSITSASQVEYVNHKNKENLMQKSRYSKSPSDRKKDISLQGLKAARGVVLYRRYW